ncbi:MAG: hypothetical protein MJA83_15190 [Gammaproteobacteria bacterium]|nr:hypothetical protein [Gammaproteobacteria bacterium]
MNSSYGRKIPRPVLERIGVHVLGLNVEGRPKMEMVRVIKDHLAAPTVEATPLEAEGWHGVTMHTQFPQTTDKQFGLKCVRCAEICVIFQPGFDPENPVDHRGQHAKFHLWPFKFVSWPGTDEIELQSASREYPKCPRCNTRIPVFNERRTVKKRMIVEIDQ